MSSDEAIDVLVVGAGPSGLSAANNLVEAGKEVVVLEARDRVGGRCRSAQTSSGTFVELGAQWLGKKGHKRLEALTKRFGFNKIPNYAGGKCVVWAQDDGKKELMGSPSLSGPIGFSTQADQAWILARLYSLSSSADFEHPLRGFGYDENYSLEDYIDKVAWSKKGAETMKGLLVQGFNRDLSEVALYSAAEFIKSVTSTANADEYYFDQGFTTLLQKYAEPLKDKIQFGCRVGQVTTTSNAVAITTTTGQTFRAKHVIFAIPPQLLQGVEFTPPLPGERNIQMSKSMVTGQVMKLVAVFASPWWRQRGLRGSIARPKGPVFATADLSHSNGNGVLVGFINGPAAEERHALSSEQLQQLFTTHLEESFGGPLAEPIHEFHYHDWIGDDLTRGGYVASVGVGQWQHHPNGLAASVGNVHFAGTETAREWRGYIEGALEAGERTAKTVIHELAADRR